MSTKTRSDAAPTRRHLPSPRLARIARGLTREQLAAAVPCCFNTVCKCEQTGEYPSRIRMRTAYLKALGLTEVTP